MANDLKAYHGKQEIKDAVLKRMRDHMDADELIRGTGWDKRSNKGCAVGCTLNNYDHKQYEIELGIPRVLARLEDHLFEALPLEDAIKFPEQFLMAIKPGADLSPVCVKFMLAILTDKDKGVLRHVQGEKYKQQREAIENVIALFERKEPVTAKQWLDASQRCSEARWAAAAAACWAEARWAAAEEACWAAAAAEACWAAAAAAAGRARNNGRDKANRFMRDTLLKLLSEAK